jgi:Flp pilus assembly protein TadD
MDLNTRVCEIVARWEMARDGGRSVSPEELCRETPELLTPVRAALRRLYPTSPLAQPTAPPESPEPPPDTPRYGFVAFLARGGMGEVWRGHDRVLNREVAIKVLRRRLGGGEAARQFREEAALVARLQHPAIVPVHDSGELADGRPFFVMKLVGGRTLADLLHEWPCGPAVLPHYLQLFGQVCQAVAFAHAHSPPVLHRDLKPSNVMVGAFGEVQVMDWGLGKLLAEPPPLGSAAGAPPAPDAAPDSPEKTESPPGSGPETLTGVTKGTPQFMAPEQARGERAALGPATDVFGLGGILCVLLTGQPPHPDGDLGKVAAGDLAEAFARLEQSAADADLVALAKRCLAPDPAGRPADAGAVTQEVAAYQAGVQERLRQAELRRAAAEGEARVERKRRRLQLVLAGAVLALVLGAGGVLWWDQQQRAAARAKQQEADQAAQAGMARARQALQRAHDQPLKEFAKYREALAEARAAAEVARGGSDPVRKEAAERLQEASRAADQGAKNRDLLTAWLDVFQPQEAPTYRPDGSGRVVALPLPSPDQQFGEALRKWGLDIDRVSAAEAVARFKGLPKLVVQEVVAGLDSWAEERQKAGRPERDWRKLAEVADRLDPNDLRGELRRLRLDSALRRKGRGAGGWLSSLPRLALAAEAHARQRGRLQSLARRVKPATESVLTVLALAQALEAAGSRGAAEAVLDAALAARPDEVVLLDGMGRLLEGQGPSHSAKAASYYQSARGLRPELGRRLSHMLSVAGSAAKAEAVVRDLIRRKPDSPELHYDLCYTLYLQQRFKEAEAALRQAIKRKPGYALARTALGVVLQARGKLGEAEAALRQVIALEPDYAAAHSVLGIVLRLRGKLAEAEAAQRQALKLKPDVAEAHSTLGVVLEQRGKLEEAEAAQRQALKLKPDLAEAHVNLGTVLAVRGKLAEAEATLRQALKLKPGLAEAHINLGIYLAVRGKLAEAETTLRQAVKLKPDSAWAQGNLGSILTERGRLAEAEAAYRRAIALKPDFPSFQNSLGHLQRLLTLEKQLPALLAEPLESRAPEELLPFASHFGSSGQRYLAAVQLYRAVFAADPKVKYNLNQQHRYKAACAAALAAVSQGKDASPLALEEAVWMSQRARAWLRADLASWAVLTRRADLKVTHVVRLRLDHWKCCDALAGVREPKCLACFPEDERRAWLALWAEVDALLKRIAEK